MPFLLLIIGALLFIVAYQNTHADVGKALAQDVPPFLKWGAAIAAVAALGWIPGMRDLSRWLLALVLVVIVLTNYKQMISGLQALTQAKAATGDSPTPAEAAAANQIPTAAQIAGQSGGALVAGGALTGGSTATAGGALSIPQLSFDPGQFLSGFGIGGL